MVVKGGRISAHDYPNGIEQREASDNALLQGGLDAISAIFLCPIKCKVSIP
jgi:hypothetical protein